MHYAREPHRVEPDRSANSATDRLNHDLIAEFVACAEVVDSTRSKYRLHLEEFRVWLCVQAAAGGHGARTLLTEAATGDVQRFLAYLRSSDRFAAPPGASGRVLSASTRKSYLATLRSFFRYCVAVRLIASDPSAGIRSPKVTVSAGLYLSADELRCLLASPGSPRERIGTYLLAYTGARAGELRGLRWQDVDFSRHAVLLRGKGGKQRAVALHPRLVGELRLWLIHQQALAERHPLMRKAKAQPDTDFVLLTRNGRSLSANALSKQLKRRAVRVGLHTLDSKHGELRSRVSPHTLRRTVATLLLNVGEPLDAIADVFGHSSVDTTRRHYAFANAERQRATIQALPF